MSGDTSDGLESTALAIADLLNYDTTCLNQVEGILLLAAGRDTGVTPAHVAGETDLGRESSENLFRQLENADVVHRLTHGPSIVESEYEVSSSDLQHYMDATRNAIRHIDAYESRQPPQTVVTPLVTFPDDPEFEATSPADFGMAQLMSTLASEIKQTEDSIVLLAPFFEGSGLELLHDVLVDALDRGVDLTIVTRYLHDRDSHNRKVISGFLETLESSTLKRRVRTIDYTVWSEDTPENKRKQDGSNPEFTLHAKLMLFDQKSVYIGSANITDYGFSRYFELGALIRGPPVSCYTSLCEFLLESEDAHQVRI